MSSKHQIIKRVPLDHLFTFITVSHQRYFLTFWKPNKKLILIVDIIIEDCEGQKMWCHLGAAPNLMTCHGRVWGQLISMMA